MAAGARTRRCRRSAPLVLGIPVLAWAIGLGWWHPAAGPLAPLTGAELAVVASWADAAAWAPALRTADRALAADTLAAETLAVDALAAGALAVGALAVGALAVGALAAAPLAAAPLAADIGAADIGAAHTVIAARAPMAAGDRALEPAGPSARLDAGHEAALQVCALTPVAVAAAGFAGADCRLATAERAPPSSAT